MAENFIYQRNDQTTISRVFKVEHFNAWLETGELYFPRPQEWEDPFENILLKQKYHRACTSVPLDFSNILDHYFGQCWTHSSEETDATWRIYAPQCDGIRVSTSIAKIYASLQNGSAQLKSETYICRVDYFPAAEIRKRASLAMQCLEAIRDRGDSCLTLLTVKRPEFTHEQEVRLILHDQTRSIPLEDTHVLVPAPPQEIIESVICDPRLSPTIFAELKAKIESRLPGVPVTQSQLYHLELESIPVYDLDELFRETD